MFLRYLSDVGSSLGVLVIIVSASFSGVACAAPASPYSKSVQTYVNEALPVVLPQASAYYDSPLAAGTLTLEDVLEAHRPRADRISKLPAIGGTPSATATAPVMGAQSGQPSSTGLMLSEGMKAVLQKVGAPPGATSASSVAGIPVPLPAAGSVNNASVGAAVQGASGVPTLLAPSAATQEAKAVVLTSPQVAAKPERVTIDGVVYEPGQAPKSLSSGGETPVVGEANTSAPVAEQVCGHDVQKWEKSCEAAGYPASYVGKIVGETRVGCADSALHDIWLTNTCAPEDSVRDGAVKAEETTENSEVAGGLRGICGDAAGDKFEEAPVDDLCEQGAASAVSGGDGWTWACSGSNGGAAAVCVAAKIVASSDGECGKADGVDSLTAPARNLCEVGVASDVAGKGPWNWSCYGSGDGSIAACSAPLAERAVDEADEDIVDAEVQEDVAPAPMAAVAEPDVSSAVENGELCGSASEILAYEAPSKGLCRVGRPGSVSGDGPWSWSCTDNEGVTSSCRTLSLESGVEPAPAVSAPRTPVHVEKPRAASAAVVPAPAGEVAVKAQSRSEPECGAAASVASKNAPADELCSVGDAGTVHAGDVWSWVCSKGKSKVSCEAARVVDGACGNSNGRSFSAAPAAELCSSGVSSSVGGGDAWRWVCKGAAGGVDMSCAAAVKSVVEKVDGVCGAFDGANLREVPSGDNLCASGTSSAVSGKGPWTWSCSGVNGGKVGMCSANKVSPPKAPGPSVSGLCGRANGVMAVSRPVEGLCASGVQSEVVGSGPWNWNCGGENGGMTVSCSSPLEPPAPIDGACGAANGVPTLVKPKSGLCSSGVTGTVNGDGPWTWTCSGANGGSPSSCVAPVAGKTAATPSVMTLSGSESTAAETARSGLVTPRLPSSGGVPALDRAVIPSLMPSKAFLKPPSLSSVPQAAVVTPSEIPNEAPAVPEGAVIPPEVSKALSRADVLSEGAAAAARIPGNHLVLDPDISMIAFAKGSDNLDADALPLLDKVATTLQDNLDVRVSLFAYADNAGSTPRAARRLSLARAVAVRTYLASKGVSESRMDVRAEGANTNYGAMDRVDIKVNK